MGQALPYLTNEDGERTAIILPIEEDEKLLEDLDDLRVIAERRGDPLMSHKAFLAELETHAPL
jgi:hypothetical protein